MQSKPTINNPAKEFNDKGYAIIDLFDEEEINALEKSIYKITKQTYERYEKEIIDVDADIDKIITRLSESNPQILFELSGLISNLAGFQRICTQDKVIELFEKITGIDKDIAMINTGISFLVNPPKSKRLQYNWHTAVQAYPKRSCFINIWMPILRDKTERNGSLMVIDGSHKHIYPWIEGKQIARDGSKALTQYRVPDEYTKGKERVITAKRGQVLLMHPLLLHSSSINQDDRPSYVFVYKVWSNSADYTPSHKLDIKMYEEAANEIQLPNVGSIRNEYSLTMNAKRLY